LQYFELRDEVRDSVEWNATVDSTMTSSPCYATSANVSDAARALQVLVEVIFAPENVNLPLSPVEAERDPSFCAFETKTEKALLPQRDRATRYVSRYLVNCRNKLYNKSTTNRMQLESYSTSDILPDAIRRSSSLAVFKRSLKTHFYIQSFY